MSHINLDEVVLPVLNRLRILEQVAARRRARRAKERCRHFGLCRGLLFCRFIPRMLGPVFVARAECDRRTAIIWADYLRGARVDAGG